MAYEDILKKRVFIADDDPGIVDSLKFMLDEEGYSVITNKSDDYIPEIIELQPDLLLLDIWMSGLDGREMCRTLKKQINTKDIPIIMISANKDTGQFAKDAGADDFIEKPFDMQELLEKVDKYVN